MSSRKVSGGVVHHRQHPTTIIGSQATSSRVSVCLIPPVGFEGNAAKLQVHMCQACQMHVSFGTRFLHAILFLFRLTPKTEGSLNAIHIVQKIFYYSADITHYK